MPINIVVVHLLPFFLALKKLPAGTPVYRDVLH
jgi:hypothetical protein